MSSEKRKEAVRLYVRENLSIAEISRRIETADKTIYRWKRDDAAKGDRHNWDLQRDLWHMSPRELIGLYVESVKELVLTLHQDPERLADSRTADAITKHIANINRIDPSNQYLGIALDLMRRIDSYLQEVDPELQARMARHWEPIKTRLVEYSQERRL